MSIRAVGLVCQRAFLFLNLETELSLCAPNQVCSIVCMNVGRTHLRETRRVYTR